MNMMKLWDLHRDNQSNHSSKEKVFKDPTAGKLNGGSIVWKMMTFIKNTKFLKRSYLKPLNTSEKHFQTILLNFPLDECKIQGGKYTVL